MYSDWSEDSQRNGGIVDIFSYVSCRCIFDSEGNPSGMIVDYEYADDFHYILDEDAWLAFCNEHLNGENSPQAFREFISGHGLDTIDGEFAFEDALRKSGIEFKKMAFY